MLHIVDDEDVLRDSLVWLARSRGIDACGHASAHLFLEQAERPASMRRATACCSTCACPT